ncbi:hypothetical protein PC116_g23240 [Phytophthora cactorum]|uniref:Uncharacterized protein n=1 Tax=Phytophthora cactorum TaxID=29920 RepID=A0A8T1D0V3_9STRA|nr:hypothetical protein Pcac1_g10412 [Phytophthora cactorum]KAG2893565.1 hypothetical protein PC114_g16194 [Phytophthora cactorum]KAG2934901.1 hypothetical protein PC117_g12526 [Phytophthora cactorum]KAG2995728.1 hypothetical protein PC120_g21679 [Phytophthora cactorum]KAG3003795.1 hypothetical protein PC119_g15834 [Phytophthora cactorum]
MRSSPAAWNVDDLDGIKRKTEAIETEWAVPWTPIHPAHQKADVGHRTKVLLHQLNHVLLEQQVIPEYDGSVWERCFDGQSDVSNILTGKWGSLLECHRKWAAVHGVQACSQNVLTRLNTDCPVNLGLQNNLSYHVPESSANIHKFVTFINWKLS